ncbi:Suf-domain-containing protein [Vararia minispora EC-137]|uniref:Suf-domain-containing protein n=1 Tax=Vararia minispora EC-137 TaxID=1314806 RepID=A0ACB8QEZ6_9AGAM|nr:Suf-domain-containing protein [Vararia minispora EC-137]
MITPPNEQILQALRSLQSPVLNGEAKGDSSNAAKAESPVQPQSEWDILRAQLKERPHDPDGWNQLVRFAEPSGDLEKIKDTYEGLLAVYPNTVAAQIAYVKHFINPNNLLFGESLFKRFLLTSPAVELWKFYLSYVRRVNTDSDKRDIVRKAYDFALNHIGQDKDSGEIWMNYIQFLRTGETNSAWEDGQKMDALRKVYHRAVQIPLENVEALWTEYEAFEKTLNPITAKKFMADLSPSYMQARTILRQLQRHLAPLFPSPPPPPTLVLPSKPTFTPAERQLVGQWKTYLRWEEGNPLELEEGQRATLISRLQGVYRKAVIRMRFFSEIWYMAYVWTASVGRTQEAMNILKAGIEANPTSFVLNFAYAEALEITQSFEEVHALYERFLDALRGELDTLEARLGDTANTSQTSQESQNPNNSQTQEFSAQAADDKPPKAKDLRERKKEYGVVWIMYMRFARRAEGQQSARTVFGKARRDKWTPWQVYEAAALREYHSTREAPVALRIYGKGLELFGTEPDFVVHYLSFLLSINDENNARAVFEQVINTFPPDKARPIWERWARHQYQYGDLTSALAIEQRMAAVYPNDPPIKRFAQRHIFDNVDAIANRDLGAAFARHGSAPGNAPAGPSQVQAQEKTQSTPSTGQGAQPLARSETQQSLPPPGKRAASPDHRRREDGYSKRARQASPPGRDWHGHGRRRYNSPGGWEHREREREREREARRQREEEEKVQLPGVLSWFIGSLPPASAFDGPVFRTDDLMQVFRNAVIPSASSRGRSPPRGGRPPPDYSPYQGPGSSRGRRY